MTAEEFKFSLSGLSRQSILNKVIDLLYSPSRSLLSNEEYVALATPDEELLQELSLQASENRRIRWERDEDQNRDDRWLLDRERSVVDADISELSLAYFTSYLSRIRREEVVHGSPITDEEREKFMGVRARELWNRTNAKLLFTFKTKDDAGRGMTFLIEDNPYEDVHGPFSDDEDPYAIYRVGTYRVVKHPTASRCCTPAWPDPLFTQTERNEEFVLHDVEEDDH